MTTVFSVPFTPETRLEAITKVMADLLGSLGKLEHVTSVLHDQGKTLADMAQDHQGPLPVGGLLVPGIETPVLLGAKISFQDDRLMVAIGPENPLAKKAFEDKGYRKVSETPMAKRFESKRGWPAALTGQQQPSSMGR
jgi:hypothetical protein